MDDYKESLRILLRPEPLVWCYFCGIWLAALLLFSYGIYQQYWLILLVPIVVYIARVDYAYCYQLRLDKSVVELRVSTQDSLTLVLKDGSEVSVDLVDKLLIVNNLALRFERRKQEVGIKLNESLIRVFRRKCLMMYRHITVFFLQDYYQVYLSEATLEQEQFRKLLRRLKKI